MDAITDRTTRAIDLAYKAHSIARVVGGLYLSGACTYRDRRVRIESNVWQRNVRVYERRWWELKERLVLDARIHPGNWLVRTFIDGEWVDHIDRYIIPDERVAGYDYSSPALRLVPA